MKNPLILGSLFFLAICIFLYVLPLNTETSTKDRTDFLPDRGILLPYRAQPITQFSAISSRPLFVKERRRGAVPTPLIESDKNSESLPSELNAVLLGVMLINDQKRALLSIENSAESVWLGIDEEWNGWRVSDVSSETVLLIAGDQSTILSLYPQDQKSESIFEYDHE